MFNTAFAGIARPSPDYYPEALRPEIDAINALVLKGVNNAVNGCGYSISQEAYDGSIKLLFETLDGLETRLSSRRYLCGDVETEADWRLFPSLVRFDPCYYVGYKCNLRRLDEYPNLSNYLRELYQTPGIAEVCDIAGMKRGVFGKAGPVGSNGIVPIGPTRRLFEAARSRPPGAENQYRRVRRRARPGKKSGDKQQGGNDESMELRSRASAFCLPPRGCARVRPVRRSPRGRSRSSCRSRRAAARTW